MSNKAAGSLFAVDLDRTLIYSRASARCRIADSLHVVERVDGKDLSFMTTPAAAALRTLADRAHVLPATTRTVEQFTRLQLPGAPWRYVVASNGGNILVDGKPDLTWRHVIAARQRHDGTAPLSEVITTIRKLITDDWVEKLRVADDIFCYLVVRPNEMPDGFLAEWTQWCGNRGWSVSRQGRKIYSTPMSVDKNAAVTEVRSRLINAGQLNYGATTFAAGDGLLDAEMLAAATAGIRPRHGELDLLGWNHSTVSITPDAGIAAAEQILDWLSRQLRN